MNASINTFSVTIQALHINEKSMTLAAFRQLPIADAYDEGGNLNPMERWGLVRCEIRDEGNLWLVANLGGQLYRCNTRHKFKSVPDAERSLRNLKSNFVEFEAWSKADALLKEQRKRTIPDDPDWEQEWFPEMIAVHIEAAELSLERSRNAEASLATLLALPQLFIAV